MANSSPERHIGCELLQLARNRDSNKVAINVAVASLHLCLLLKVSMPHSCNILFAQMPIGKN